MLIPSKSIIGKRLAISPCQHVGRQPQLSVRGDAVVDVGLLGREEEQDAALDQDRQARDGAQRLPLGQRIRRHARVDRVLAVGRTREAGFAAGRGAAVRRPPRVDQSDLDGPAAAGGARSRRRTRRRRSPRHVSSCLVSSASPLAGRNGSAARPDEERAARDGSHRASRQPRSRAPAAAAAEAAAAGPGTSPSRRPPIRPGRSASAGAAEAAEAAAAAAAARRGRRSSAAAVRPIVRGCADIVADASAQAALAIERQHRVLVEDVVHVSETRARGPTSGRPTH